jgi:hypothetical protein
MTTQFRPAFLFSFALLFSTTHGFVCGQMDHPTQEASARSAQDSALRGAFLGNDNDPAQSRRVVGRLAILLKTDEGFKRVRSDYSFRSGDRFRFEVTANQDGWLYVMHSVPGSDWQQLWPTTVNTNKLQSRKSYEIPPAPGIFVFDQDIGREFFYLVIRSDIKKPIGEKSGATVAREDRPTKPKTPPSKQASGETINFLVRDPFGESTRGVVFDPGKDDVDPYLYFSAELEETTKTAKVRFQLHHTD